MGLCTSKSEPVVAAEKLDAEIAKQARRDRGWAVVW